ncbi:MAG: lysylphosphatidylglycerol synthase transmembrane domain-containing protein [Bacteroidota bacterium]|nr:lysylphosphatidylglycerol synthase transmembrane domain-containing protein [Bacteroidota bacterium]
MKKLYHNLKIIFPPFLGIFFIYLSVVMTSDEERKLIISYIINADLKYIISAIVFGILSHLSRAFRWKFLLNPLGYYPRFINSILAVLVSYIANLGIPRSGEILRATTLSNYEKIPFEKLFGTIIAERLIDFIILLSLIFLTLSLQFESIWEILREKTFDLQKLIAVIFILLLIFFGLKKFLGKNNSKILTKIKAFIEGLIEGIMSIKNMPYKLAFASHTIFIWTMYFSMFYIIKWTIPEMQNLQIIQMLPSFVIGGLTLTATNGGIGIYPLSVAMTLSSFGISNESGLAFGWIVWTSQTLMIIFFGSLSFFILPLVNRKK